MSIGNHTLGCCREIIFLAGIQVAEFIRKLAIVAVYCLSAGNIRLCRLNIKIESVHGRGSEGTRCTRRRAIRSKGTPEEGRERVCRGGACDIETRCSSAAERQQYFLSIAVTNVYAISDEGTRSLQLCRIAICIVEISSTSISKIGCRVSISGLIGRLGHEREDNDVDA